MKDLATLEAFHHRQVVINYFEEDCLIERDGFDFERVRAVDGALIFEGKNQIVVPLDGFQGFELSPVFSRCFLFKKGDSRMEIYFP